MKVIFAALSAFALVSYAQVYDRSRSIGEEWQQQWESAEMQRIEQAAKQRESEHSNRVAQLERQQKIQQQENEWRQRQLELEQLRLWLWSPLESLDLRISHGVAAARRSVEGCSSANTSAMARVYIVWR